jgi:hypothetical protein
LVRSHSNITTIKPGLAADFAGHVVSAAHRRFYFPVAIWTFGNSNLSAGTRRDHIVLKFLSALTAGHSAYAHAAFFAGICCHNSSSH